MVSMKNRSIYTIAFLLFLGGIGWLCYMGFTEDSVYFLNVSEAFVADKAKLEKVRLFGVVTPEIIRKDSSEIHFQIADKDSADKIILVEYAGIVPDNFKEGAEVIVEGGMGENGNFRAATLMTKCPSKYKKENRQRNI